MEKNWLVRTNQTITFLPMVIVIFIGLIGYEWVRTELVGSWILLIGFILLGRFLNVVQSVVLSIVIFIILFIYILFNVQADSMDINTRFLQLFILPVAPLLLSIYYEMMSTQTQVQDMLNLNLIPQYDEIYIEITNHSLLRDMLQVDELKLLQQKIIHVLENKFEVPHFSFTDSRLSVLRVITIADRESTISKQLIEKIKQIELIKTEITHLPHHQGRPSLEERL